MATKNFKEMVTLNGRDLMIVDALNLAFRYKHARSTEFVEDYINTVKSLQQSYKCKHVILACDKGASQYRKDIFPEYKANRKEKQAEQTPEEELEFKMFIEEFERTIEEASKHFIVFRFQGVEADDISAYICAVQRQYQFDNIWNISSDRDWDLLCAPNVSRFSYVTRKEITWDNWSSHYDCNPDEYISMKVLAGDTGDNIDGVSGVGPKRSAELIRQYGSAFDIVAALPIQSKYKYVQALNSCGEVILRNYQLMDLVSYCEEAIGEENVQYIDKVLGELQ
jgi:5'-3' exonuclease